MKATITDRQIFKAIVIELEFERLQDITDFYEEMEEEVPLGESFVGRVIRETLNKQNSE